MSNSTDPHDQLSDATDIAAEAYVYAYPLVLMEITRRVMTNIATASGLAAPVNQFAHVPEFPDATFTDVVRPNADTLYSSMHFDVTDEPLVITVPASGGRYYMLPMLDMWTDVFAVPGSRTTGDEPQTLALTGPGWRGALPAGAIAVPAPTPQGWIIGRTRTDGSADYAAAHEFQHGLTVAPLSRFGKPYTALAGTTDANLAMTPPPDQVEALSPGEFFALFTELLSGNPPHANDFSILARMARLGVEPGRQFNLASASPHIRAAIENGTSLGLARLKAHMMRAGVLVNGWRINMTAIGTYGADYLGRAGIAYAGLGANPIEDAVYPTAFARIGGQAFDSGTRYRMHFEKDQIPPVRGFWSLTMYDQRQLFADNPIDRYAIGDRDPLAYGADGSLDLYIQRESPGSARETNWLPAPQAGEFSLNLRLYWPSSTVLDGTWTPPEVQSAP